MSVWKGTNPDPRHYDELWDGFTIDRIYGFKSILELKVEVT